MTAHAEFHRPVPIDQIDDDWLTRELKADAAECAALAARFHLVALHELKASCRARVVAPGPVIRVTGRLTARLEQQCVVTLEPVPAALDEEFSADFAPQGWFEGRGIDEEEGLPELLEGDKLDLGEVVAQSLALALDPYPRAPGAALPAAASAADPALHPFAALAALKGGPKKAD